MSQDDQAVNTEVEAVTTPTESAPEENKAEEVVDTGEYSQEHLETENQQEEQSEPVDDTQEPEEAEESAAHDDKQEEQLAPKSFNRFQQLANQNRELREQVETLKAKQAQFATEQELLNQVNPETGDYYTIAEAERASRLQFNQVQQQNLAQQQYQLEVQQNQQQITTEAEQALNEFPELDSQSPQFDAEIAAEYNEALAQALIMDERGAPIGAYLSPYKLAKSIAGPARRAAEKAKAIGQADAQKATSKMLASVDPGSSSSHSNKSFDKLSLEEMEARLRAKGHQI